MSQWRTQAEHYSYSNGPGRSDGVHAWYILIYSANMRDSQLVDQVEKDNGMFLENEALGIERGPCMGDWFEASRRWGRRR